MVLKKAADIAYNTGTISNAIARTGDAAGTISKVGTAAAEKTQGFWKRMTNWFMTPREERELEDRTHQIENHWPDEGSGDD